MSHAFFINKVLRDRNHEFIANMIEKTLFLILSTGFLVLVIRQIFPPNPNKEPESSSGIQNINSKYEVKRKHGFAALISLILPGVGQLIKGQIFKAICIWIISGLMALFFWIVLLVPPVICVPILFWMWNIYDAYNS